MLNSMSKQNGTSLTSNWGKAAGIYSVLWIICRGVREGAGESQVEGLGTSGGGMESDTVKRWDFYKADMFFHLQWVVAVIMSHDRTNGVFKVTFYSP